MPTTIKSLFDKTKDKLIKKQDFETAGTIRDIQRALDLKGTKKLNKNQARITQSFLNILAKRAYT